MTLDDILATNNLHLPSTKPGRYYVPCPKCSTGRRREHRLLKVLGITIDDKGVNWGCNHCGWTGGGYTNGRGNGQERTGFAAAIYPYHDEQGELLFEVCRTWSKTFPQRKPNGHGGFDWRTQGVRKVLFRLPELMEAVASEHIIAIPEGEKDVLNLVRRGIPATCNPGGAGKWLAEFSEALRGADIVILPDHDEPGYSHAEAIARMSLGIAKRIRILKLAEHWPACPKGGDVSDWLEAGHTREQLDALIDNAPDYQPQSAKSEGELPPLPWIDVSRWDSEPVPEQAWAVFNRMPLRQCALFSGEGAGGKSTVELHRSVAHVLGRDWLGTMPEPGPAIFVDAEDEVDVIHRRLAAVARHYNVTFADMIKGGLHIMSLVGRDAVLVTVSRSGKVEPTTLYQKLVEAAGDIKPKSITIASSANVFTGDENNRTQVTQFVGMLTHIAIVANGSVSLISHPSLTGITSDSGLSGTTQWHNAVRARSYMRSPKPKPDEQPDTDLRELIFKKNQYGPVSETIVLHYRDGMFLPVPGIGTLDKIAREAKADELFLRLVDETNRRNERVSSLIGAHMYAPTLFAADAEAKTARVTKDNFKAAMERLFRADKIHLEQYGPASRDTWKIVRGPKPDDPGAEA
jgi:RecA-family ATPase